MRSVPTLLALSLLAAGASFASSAHAAEGDDRFALRLGAMKLPVTTRIVAKEDW